MIARSTLSHPVGFLALFLALFVGVVSPTHADVEAATTTTTGADETIEPDAEGPTKPAPPPRPSSAPT